MNPQSDRDAPALTPQAQLQGLLDYLLEQARQIDPRGFRLAGHKDFIRRRAEVCGLPGVGIGGGDDDEAPWIAVERLVARTAPAFPDDDLAGRLLRIPDDPSATGPAVDEAALAAQVAATEAQPSAGQPRAGGTGRALALVPVPPALPVVPIPLTLSAAPTVAAAPATRETQTVPTMPAQPAAAPPAPAPTPAARLRQSAEAALARYLPLWTAWAEAERPRRRSIVLYGELFTLHQRLRDDTADPCELVWGIGIAAWRLEHDGAPLDFEYPLITQQLEIDVNDLTLAVEVRPRAVPPRLEMDAFVACDVAAAIDTEHAVREQMKADGAPLVSPFDADSYAPLLRRIAGNLDGLGRYVEVKDSGGAVPPAGRHLVVTDDWVLLARPRRADAARVDVETLKSRLDVLPEVPDGPAAFVTPGSTEPIAFEPVRFRGVSSAGGSSGVGTDGEVQELYFPEPYNDEQVTIVEHLERAPGVTVQGPPGTGKTHTIANIVCHYLATGRRVLVTSAGEPALRVLQNKIPEEVRALTVALLTGDREGQKQFEGSIRVIQQQVTQLNPAATRERIAHCRSAIDRSHAEIHAIDRRVDEIALAQLSEVEVDGQPMRADRLAERVADGEQGCGWFPDALTLDAGHAPPLTEDEAAQLRAARRALGDDLAYVGRKLPPAAGFPPAREIAALHAALVRIEALDAETAEAGDSALKGSDDAVLAAARALLARLAEARDLAEALESQAEAWPLELRRRCREASFAPERRALEALFPELDALAVERAEFLQRPVSFPAAALACADTRKAVRRGAESGKPLGFFSSFGAGAAKQYLPAIRVAALEPRSADDWAHVERYLQLHEKVLVASVRWNELAAPLGLPRLEGGVTALRDIELTAGLARRAHRLAGEFDASLARDARGVLLEVDEDDFTGGARRLEAVMRLLQRHLARAELADAALGQVGLRARLDGTGGPVVDRLQDFVARRLGDPSLGEQAVALEFDALMSELRRIEGLAEPLALVVRLAARLAAAGAQHLAALVASRVQPAAGDDTALPTGWREAWNWSRIRSHLDAIEAREELLDLAARRRELEAALRRLYRELVAKSAWLRTKENATSAVLSALNGYATAMRLVGKGTGLNAPRYLRDARQAMLQAVGAVPCWIMSHARVSETLPADVGAFDLVIVDEASQSGLWALPAVLRAKKVLVVGDDRQVSPSAGFIEAARIDDLRSRFLAGQPYGAEMTPEKSLYDLAARVFAADQVMLREHFRCAPPIIAYSNSLFYGGRIQPLRIPKADERIEPPLVDLFVTDGVRRRDVNDGEARAIAAEIEALLADPRFDGRTLGVVTLMSGPAQAKAIDAAVRARCDAAELMRRRFEVGDAARFQGSERDIVFLSMVVDRDACHALSGLAYEQRFNVAASRARDRMVLVRSVELADLSDKDVLRRRLLEHFRMPMVAQAVQPDELSARCESGFERQVFEALASRGYRVVPQVPAGDYRIDLVVEGDGDRRLAIECDGDAFHGPERWPADMHRQRVLERAGWTFWRCFASTWTRHRDEVLAELLQRLAALGIEPVGALREAPLLVERRSFTSGAGEAAVDGGKPQTAAVEAPPAALAPMASDAQEVAVQEAAG